MAREKAAQRELLESQRQQREVRSMAFQRWLKVKQNEDAARKKEQAYLNEVEKLRQQNKAEEKRRSKERFEMWKTQKDYESHLQRENEKEMSRIVTPLPRGMDN